MARPQVKDTSIFVFTDTTPMLPVHPDFDVYEDWTPTTWLEHCHEQWPQQCAECGKKMIRKLAADQFRFFCTNTCKSKWSRRLKEPILPSFYRYRQWPGKDDGEYPPEMQMIRDIWHDLKGEGANYVRCGGTNCSYPTNDEPMRKDKRGTRCMQPAGWGTQHKGTGNCRLHGGATPNYNKKVMKDFLLEKAEIVSMIYGTAVEDIQPEEAIMQELARTAGHVQWLYENLQTQDQKLLEEHQGEGEALRQYTKLGQQPSVWIDLYFRERQHLMSVAKTASSMGIAERQIRIAEEQGQLLAETIRAFMNDPDLALTPEQMVRAPGLIRRHLAALPVGSKPTPTAPTIIDENGEPISVAEVVTEDQLLEEPQYPEEG